MSDKTFLTTGESELDEETERLMWEYRVASRSAATVVAANALRSRIRHLVEEAREEVAWAAYQQAFQSWQAGGRKGPPPPRPIRPHTPGWKIPE